MSAEGNWEITINSPMGPQKANLELGADGGKMSGQQGDLALKDVSIDGDSASWKADVTTPIALTLEFDGSVDGDSISGNVKFGAFGSGTFSGTRA